MERFSVLLPVYYKDVPRYFDLALESVFKSSTIPDEVVIVEDGPLTKDLYSVVDKYKEKYSERVKVVILKENVGLGMALSRGVNACSFDIIARMDADDICCSNRFEEQLHFLNNNKNVSIVGSNVVEYDENMLKRLSNKNVPESDSDIKKYCVKRNPFNHMSVMFRKRDVLSVGNYKPMEKFEDYYLWCRLLNKYSGHNIQKNLMLVRGGDAMYRRRGGIEYAKNIFSFQKTICNMRLITRRQEFANLLVRVPIAMSPTWMKGMVYKRVLRSGK